MYGLIVKLTAAPGRREELMVRMGGGDSDRVAGCLSFVVAEDAADENVLWITEVWTSRASHEASLAAPPIQASLGGADELIVRFEKMATTQPVAASSGPFHRTTPEG